ncbi:MAG: MarR family transcriptional regulator, partial [Phascolarctobacterium sp.]
YFTLKNNFREPELYVDLQKTRLKIWTAFPKDAYVEFSQDVQDVLVYIRNNGCARMKEIEKNTGQTNYSVRKAVKQLLEKGLIVIQGQGKATIYVWKYSKIENIAALDKMKNLLMEVE